MNKYLRIALIWTICTIILSSLSTKTASNIVPFDLLGIDKIGHLFFYAVMSYTWICGLKLNKTKINPIFLTLLLCNGIGIMMEFYQKYYTDRNFEYDDMLANGFGTLIGVFMFYKFYKESND
jgi:VanZ family protein